MRIFDAFYKLIFKYDPEKRNHNNKVLYCMMNDNHIYTINQNALSLQHISEDEEPNEYLVYASNDYRVKEKEAIDNFMVDTIVNSMLIDIKVNIISLICMFRCCY